MTIFNHHVSVSAQYWGKGLLGEGVLVEEYTHIYFSPEDPIENAYKLIDKLLKAGKKQDLKITIRECGERIDPVRRLFIDLDLGFREYGVASVGICDRTGRFDDYTKMDAKAVRAEIISVIDQVAAEQKRSVEE